MPVTSVPSAKVLKFFTVLGTVFPKSPITTLPASSPPIEISKKTCKNKNICFTKKYVVKENYLNEREDCLSASSCDFLVILCRV